MFIQIIRLDPDIIQINIIEFQVSTCIIVRQSGFGYQADFINIIIRRSTRGPYANKIAIVVQCKL